MKALADAKKKVEELIKESSQAQETSIKLVSEIRLLMMLTTTDVRITHVEIKKLLDKADAIVHHTTNIKIGLME